MKKYYTFVLCLLTLGMYSCTNTSSMESILEPSKRVADCSAKNSTWETCYKLAAADCPKGYQIIEKRDYIKSIQGRPDYISGVISEMKNGKNSTRQMSFKCNK